MLNSIKSVTIVIPPTLSFVWVSGMHEYRPELNCEIQYAFITIYERALAYNKVCEDTHAENVRTKLGRLDLYCSYICTLYILFYIHLYSVRMQASNTPDAEWHAPAVIRNATYIYILSSECLSVTRFTITYLLIYLCCTCQYRRNFLWFMLL